MQIVLGQKSTHQYSCTVLIKPKIAKNSGPVGPGDVSNMNTEKDAMQVETAPENADQSLVVDSADEPVQCEVCCALLESKSDLDDHMISAHVSGNPFLAICTENPS